jgi:hypothetical protein
MSSDAELDLLSLIDSFLAGNTDILTFEEKFDAVYFDEALASALGESANEFFGEVQELVTFANPSGSFDEVDRAAGVMTYEEYATWLMRRVDSISTFRRVATTRGTLSRD